MNKLNPNDYKQIFYIDINGNDDNNGTIENPCKTINGLLSKINTKINTLIYLNEGTYEIDETIFNKGGSCSISICGKRMKTTLKQIKGFFSNHGGGSSSFNCSFYDLVYTAPNITDVNTNYIYGKYNFYNVVFKNIENNSYAFFCSQNEINFYNCVKVEESYGFLRATGGEINLYGCYGAFTSGYGTSQSMWDKKDNLIINSPKLDNDFKIINGNNSLYGVYSGDNSWKLSKYLLKQNDRYYSIKVDLFDKEKEIYLPCERDFEKNGIDDLSELTKDKCIDFCIGKKENIVNGSLFSFSLKNINSILNIISNNDRKNYELQIGNRKNLIKISCSSNLIEKGNIETLIDGEKEDNLWLNNGNMNESILFEFPYPVSITGINIIQSFVNQQGIWELCGSNDNNKYVSLNDSIEFNNKMNKFININSYKYYKLKQKNGTTSRSSYIYEIEFDIQNIYYLLINQQNKYFTINNNNVIELKEYINNNDFYIKNGFNISNFSINLIKDYFNNVNDLNLFIFSKLNNTELNIKYKLNKPFKPINCFKGEIELIQAEEK